MARVERPQMKTAELESYQDQLLSIRQDATGLMSGLSDAQFNWQAEPGRWSMSGCFVHLNLSAAELFMPSIDAAIATARTQNLKSTGPFVYSAFERWYVNLERPLVRSAVGFDLDDLFLDLLVEPDRSHRWLDEDELEQALEAGLLTTEDAAAARAEGERVLAEWPFPTGWENFRPESRWELPELPAGWDVV